LALDGVTEPVKVPVKAPQACTPVRFLGSRRRCSSSLPVARAHQQSITDLAAFFEQAFARH